MTEWKNKGISRRLALGGGAVAVLAAGGAWLSRAGGGQSRHEITPAGVFHRGNVADPGSLDPNLFQSESEQNVLQDLMVGLMTSDPAANPVPGMATSWTTSEDGLTWTFKLREALWSDGVPVTADDFIFSWRRLLDPKFGASYAYFIYCVKNARAVNAGKLPLTALGVSAPDPHTLVMALEHPAPYLLEMLTHMSIYPVPRHVVGAKGKDWSKPENYVCNGPFTLAEWVPHDHITLNKNPRFYDAANVKLDKVIFYPTDDYGAALKQFRAGELDIQLRLPSEQIDWIRQNMPETLDPTPQLTMEMVVCNQGRPPFGDVRVRAAVNYVLNREAITNKIRRVGDMPAYNIVPPGTANFPGGNAFDFKSWPYDQRIAKAQELMRQAGFGPGKRVKTTFMIRSTAAGAGRAVAAAIQAMLALAYIDVSIIPNDFPIFINATQIHDFDMAEAAWGADFNDAETFLALFQTGGGDNWGQYSNPAFDALLAAEQREKDLTARGRILAEAEAQLIRDHAAMPLYFFIDPDIVRPYVKGWVGNSTNYHLSRWVSIDQKARAALFAGPATA
jgi:oligopeptide transport system substrate-binding protein